MSEIRDNVRRRVIREIFGNDWRPDRPLENIGNKLGFLLRGKQDYASYEKAVAEINGLLAAERIVNDAVAEVNQPPQGRAA